MANDSSVNSQPKRIFSLRGARSTDGNDAKPGGAVGSPGEREDRSCCGAPHPDAHNKRTADRNQIDFTLKRYGVIGIL